jgi:hypothetical protein
MKPPALNGGSHWWRKEPPSLDNVGMRQRGDTTAASAGQREREGNRWIKWGSRIDLKDMRPDSIRQLAGALGTRAGLRQPDRYGHMMPGSEVEARRLLNNYLHSA